MVLSESVGDWPTALTLSPCEMAALVTLRPMWPEAPKTSHTACLAGLEGDGGSVLEGSCTLGKLDVVVDEEDVGGRATSSVVEMRRWDMLRWMSGCLHDSLAKRMRMDVVLCDLRLFQMDGLCFFRLYKDVSRFGH